MNSYIQLLGPAHLSILASVIVLAIVLAVLQRTVFRNSKVLRLCFAVVLLCDTAVYYGHLALHGQLTFPGRMPLELCDFSLFLIIAVLFTLNKPLFDMAYYWALAGATMALLTPNLLEPFPSFGTVQFFIAHGLIVTGTLYLVWSGLARPRPRSVYRAMLGVNCVAVVVGTFDYFFQTDYMYLRTKPQNASLLDLLGPWPWYLLITEFVAFALFQLLYLPYRSWRSSSPYIPEIPEPAELIETSK